MEKGSRPIAELRPGHYAVGLLPDGTEIDIYAAGHQLVNVATGQPVTDVTGWKYRDASNHDTPRPSLL